MIMEQRKIMQLGRSSLVISLPKQWVNKSNLQKGDIISVEMQQDHSLVIYPIVKKEKKSKKITLYIDPKDENSSIIRSIIACYLNGYSDIILISRKIFSTSQQRAIRRIMRNLFIRIIESDPKNIKTTIFMDESRISVVSNIRRMYNISHSMCKDALNALKDRDVSLARTVYSLDDDVDHFCFLLLRLLRSAAINPGLSKNLDLDPLDCLDYEVLVYRIEHIADNAATIAKNIIILEGMKLKIPDSLIVLILKFGKQAVKLLDLAFNSFFTQDIAVCNELIEKQKKIKELDHEIASKTFLIPKMEAMTICSVCSIRDAVMRISDWAVALAENAILRSYSA